MGSRLLLPLAALAASMAWLLAGTEPGPSAQQEIARLLAGAPEPPATVRPLNLLLVAGKKDHAPGEHDYPAWQAAWSKLLPQAPQVAIQTAMEWPSPEQLAKADAAVFYRRGDWSAERAASLDAFLQAGKGAVFIHWAVEGGPEALGLAQRIGWASDRTKTKYRHGQVEWNFPPGLTHPIARNFTKVAIKDETYWNLVPNPAAAPLVLASATEDGGSHPQCWTVEPKTGGRVFVTLGGHYTASFDQPVFRILLLRGIAWAAGAPVDRLNSLVER